MREIVQVEDEYKKHPDLKREAVQELAEWIEQFPDYRRPTDVQVTRFLFSCYFDMEDAKKCVKAYYTLRHSNIHLFYQRDILRKELQEQLNVIQYGVIPKKDPNGSIIVLHRLQIFDPPRYVFTESAGLLSMLTEAILQREGNMQGFIVVFDMRGVSIMHVFRLKISALKLFFQYVQEGLPLRLKAVHIVNTLPIASKIMFLIRPFLNKELLNSIHFHSDNYEEVQKHIPKDCLPSDFGGTQASMEELHEDYKKWMMELRNDFVDDDEEERIFIAKREEAKAEAKNKKANHSSSWF